MRQEMFNTQLGKILEEADPKEAFYKLCDLYLSADGEQREDIRRQWPFDRPWKLSDQTRLACIEVGERPCAERMSAMKKENLYRLLVILNSRLLMG
jgi:hypothetical protein